jgi:hypothetical protein
MVVNMGDMFRQAAAFNQSLEGWNTSLVEIMSDMFSSWDTSTCFNQPLARWDTSR